MTKFIKIKKKTYFGVIFSQTEFFLKTLAKYNYSGPQHLDIKDPEWTGHQTKNYSITISMLKSFNQSAQFIKSFVRYTCFKSPMIYKISLIFYHAHPIIIKVIFSFPKFVSACKTSAHLINSFLRYNRF